MDQKEQEPATRAVEFHHKKSNFFRVIHADGVIGGLTPHGNVHCTFYSERPALPRKTMAEFSADGNASSERIVDSIGGVVRELETDVVMGFNSAAAFYFWFESQLEQLRAVIGMTTEDWDNMKAKLKKNPSAMERPDVAN